MYNPYFVAYNCAELYNCNGSDNVILDFLYFVKLDCNKLSDNVHVTKSDCCMDCLSASVFLISQPIVQNVFLVLILLLVCISNNLLCRLKHVELGCIGSQRRILTLKRQKRQLSGESHVGGQSFQV